MADTDQLTLAADFAAATRDDWRKLVDGVLKGTPYEKLQSKTYDDLTIEPIYRRAHGTAALPGRSAATPWQIMQRIDHPDAAMANAQALHDLENGATGLTLVFAGANGARGFGLPPTKQALAQTLDGVFLDAGIALEFEIGKQSRGMGEHFIELLDARGIAPASVNVRFGLDPIGGNAVRGGSGSAWDATATVFGEKIAQFKARGFAGPFAAADGRGVHDAGGSEAQELAFVLSVGVAYLRALEDHGLPLDDARRTIYARLSADADQFLTMAKFRALRLLWARIEQSCGLEPEPLCITADTSWRMLTQRDPYVNILRATVAAFSAGLGGANSICVMPHTLAMGLPDALARRIARNTQLVLLEESNLAKVSDPAAGSGAIETLTGQLCQTAWELFQETEKAGGAFAALEQNIIQRPIAATRALRHMNLGKRRQMLTGASEFPNLDEEAAEVLIPRGDLPPSANEVESIRFDALAPYRLAEPFEKLRDASDRIRRESGSRPKVFFANLGSAADFTARAAFAKSFFETGGIEAAGGDGFAPPFAPETSAAADTTANDKPRHTGLLPMVSWGGEPDPAEAPQRAGQAHTPSHRNGLADAFKDSGAALVCICSSDKIYADHAIAAAKALHAAGANHIYLAGRPGALEEALRESGVGGFIFAGCDALATLEAAYGKMRSA